MGEPLIQAKDGSESKGQREVAKKKRIERLGRSPPATLEGGSR